MRRGVTILLLHLLQDHLSQSQNRNHHPHHHPHHHPQLQLHHLHQGAVLHPEDWGDIREPQKTQDGRSRRTHGRTSHASMGYGQTGMMTLNIYYIYLRMIFMSIIT